MPRSSKWSISLRFPNLKSVHFSAPSYMPHAWHIASSLIWSHK
jgi:hypothetical protein